MKIILSKQLEDQYVQQWNLEINRNRKCTIYRIFKETHGFEKYLTKLNFVDRRALCKFRTGNHRLPISKSRYMTEEIDITCKLCNSDDVACDEYHVLFICKHFEEKRKILLKKYFYNRPNTFKMNSLFNTTNIKQLKNLAKFSRVIMSEF